MPNIFTRPGSIYSPGAMSLDDLSTRKRKVSSQKETIAHLTAEGHGVLREKLVKIGAKMVSHGRYVVFQLAEVAVPRQMFQDILRMIAELRPQPPPALA